MIAPGSDDSRGIAVMIFVRHFPAVRNLALIEVTLFLDNIEFFN
jgi:hypothetical protein